MTNQSNAEYVNDSQIEAIDYIHKHINAEGFPTLPMILHDSIGHTHDLSGAKITLNKITKQDGYQLYLTVTIPIDHHVLTQRRHMDICIRIGKWYWWDEVNTQLKDALGRNADCTTIRDLLRSLYEYTQRKAHLNSMFYEKK